jgi:DNA-binding transcriptional regulator YiaG
MVEGNMRSKKSKHIAKKIVAGFKELSKALSEDAPIAEKFTCRKVTLDLHPIPYSPEAVRATRLLLRVSQPVFGQFLGVKPSTIKSWEQGRQQPHDMACRFMDEIQRNPEYWRKRLRDSIRIRSM